MPYETVYVPAAIALQHHGVTVFHVYKDDDIEQGRRSFAFDTDVNSSDQGANDSGFDVRDIAKQLKLSEPSWGADVAILDVIRAGIDAGLIERNENDGQDEYAEAWKASDAAPHAYSDPSGNGYCFVCGLVEGHSEANHV